MKKLLFLTIMLFTASLTFGLDYSIELSDSYGDGWNGGSIDVLVNGTVVLDDITLASGAGPESHAFTVDVGDVITTDYTAGNWAYENEYQIKDETGTVVAESGQGGVEPGNISYTVPVPPTCPAPSDIYATNILDTQAAFGWTENGSATVWNIEVGAPGFTPGTTTYIQAYTGVTSNPYTGTGLTASTNYEFYVQADCGGKETSNWAGPEAFSTNCPAVTTFPFSENFDAAQTTPNCWTNNSTEEWEFGTSASYGASEDHTTGSGYFAWVDDSSPYSNPSNLDSPLLDVTSLTTPMLSFWYWIGVNTTGSTLYIDVFNGTFWTEGVASYTPNNQWDEGTINISSYSSVATQIRFRAIENESGYDCDICIDDVTVGEAPSCPAPVDLTVTDILQTQADFGWTENGSATVWNIEVGAPGFTPGTTTYIQAYTGVTTNPYTGGGLTASTSYECYVQADCGTKETSTWTGPVAFTTLCVPYTAPFSEDFDGTAYGDMPNCWHRIVGTAFGSYVQVHTTGSYSAPNNLRMYNGSSTTEAYIAATPQLSDLTSQLNQIRFYAKSSDPSDLLIGTMTDPTDELTFTLYQTIDLTATYTEYIVMFGTGYTGADQYIAFKHGQNSTYDYINIDDFVYEPIPACPKPSALYADNIGLTTADLNWTENGTTSLWNIEVGAPGFTPGTGTALFTYTGVTTNPYPISGLTQFTPYDFSVQADCGTSQSNWGNNGTFNTKAPGYDCSVPYYVTTPLPFSLTGMTTCGYGDDYDSGDACGSSYMNGDDFVFEYTPANNIVINIVLSNTDTYADVGVFVTEGCPDVGTCVGSAGVMDGSPSLLGVPLTGGTTYYITVSTWPTPDCTSFDILIEEHTPAIWTGTAKSTSWDVAGNWDIGIVPDETRSVIIPGGASVYPVLTGQFYIKYSGGSYRCLNLTIQNGGLLEVFETADLDAYGDVTVEAGGTLLCGDDIYIQSGGNLYIYGGTVANNFDDAGGSGDVRFYSGSGGVMTGGSLTIFDAFDANLGTNWTATGGTMIAGGNEELVDFEIDEPDFAIFNLEILAGIKSSLSSSSSYDFEINGDFTQRPGSQFTIYSPEIMNVAGNVLFESDATGTASFIDNGTLNTSKAEATVERYFSGNGLDWHLVSSPISNATANVFSGMYLQSFDEATEVYTDIVDPLTSLGVMQGYGLYSNLADENTVSFTGTLNAGDQTIGVTANGNGWNLVGNPYAASIDWDDVTLWSGNISNEIHYIEASTGNDLYYVQGVGGTGSRYIPPMQGFFIKASAAETFTLNAYNRTHNGTDIFYKSQVNDLLILKASGVNYSDEAWIHFNEQAGVEHDGIYDAYKRISLSNPELPQIFSITPSGVKLAINGMPETEMVPVGFTAVESGEFTINAIEISEFANIVLEDLFTQTQTDLISNSYTFTYTVGDDEARFIVHFTPLAVDENAEDMFGIYSYNKDVYISVPENTKGDIVIYNMMGQEVASAPINSALNKITLEESAYYVVKVLSDESLVTRKVFIK